MVKSKIPIRTCFVSTSLTFVYCKQSVLKLDNWKETNWESYCNATTTTTITEKRIVEAPTLTPYWPYTTFARHGVETWDLNDGLVMDTGSCLLWVAMLVRGCQTIAVVSHNISMYVVLTNIHSSPGHSLFFCIYGKCSEKLRKCIQKYDFITFI